MMRFICCWRGRKYNVHGNRGDRNRTARIHERRTLGDAFIILDEAQNTTSEQMKMFLTRIGMNSKAVITGDITQIDLPSGRNSGLIEARTVLSRFKVWLFVISTKAMSCATIS